MRLPFLRPKIEHLDLYLARKAYGKALAAIEAELEKRPEDLRLRRRKADLLLKTKDIGGSIEILQDLARRYVEDGFHARAVALFKEILKLDPDRPQIHRELASLIRKDRKETTPPPLRQEEDPEAGARERAASSLFTLFDTDALEEVLTSTNLRVYKDGDIIVTEGEDGSSLFFVVDGCVKVFSRGRQGESVFLDELGPGAFFGEVAVLYGKPRTATITACSPTTAIEVTKQEIDRIARDHPQVRSILEQFCEERAQNAVSVLVASRRSVDSTAEPPG